MEIRKITQDKKQFLVLLLLADEQESMIDLYLERGTMYVLDDPVLREMRISVTSCHSVFLHGQL